MRIAGRSAQRARLACASLSMLLVLASPLFAQGQRGQGQRGQGANPQAPAAQHPPALQNDLFTSKNFYKDKALWSDPRYFRCNSPRQLTDIWRSQRIGNNPPTSAYWGDCKNDFPRE